MLNGSKNKPLLIDCVFNYQHICMAFTTLNSKIDKLNDEVNVLKKKLKQMDVRKRKRKSREVKSIQMTNGASQSSTAWSEVDFDELVNGFVDGNTVFETATHKNTASSAISPCKRKRRSRKQFVEEEIVANESC